MGTKLNIGGGTTELEGFTCVDRRHGLEAYPLPYEDDSVDEIRASHVLEHFGWNEREEVVRDWARVLKPGGQMSIAVPDFGFIANQYVNGDGNGSVPLLFAYAMGGQTDENDFHKSAYDRKSLANLMESAGIHNIERWESELDDCASLSVSLNLRGTKMDKPVLQLPPITALMSTAKLGFTENLFCAIQVLVPRGIQLIKTTGAFWGQCLERVMMDAIDEGAEWLLTLDYDTAFTDAQLERLCFDLATHPEIDALAPWQAKRESDDPLAWFQTEEGERRNEIPLTEFQGDVTPAWNAHFGLTLFRVSALKKLKHPWFIPVPNDDGEWRDGRVDEDINFWAKWHEAGNTLYVDNRVSIGHLQQMVTWVAEDMTTRHQYITDFQENGPPGDIRA